jgi:hypothetical protein
MGTAPSADDDRPLEERLLALTDSDGTLATMVTGMRALVRSPLGRLAMKRFLGVDPEEMAAHVDNFDSLLGVTAEGIRQFTALGWAPSGLSPVTGVKDALAQLADTGSVEDAEQVLADAWDDLLKTAASLVSRVGTLGLPSEPYNAVFQERRRLIFKAWEHHRAGAYEASVPMVYAQVEGICFDVTNKPFFSTREDLKVQPVDDETLAGLHEALPVARNWFSAGLRHTSLSPNDGSRHGVMHGRALRYDNHLLSVKVSSCCSPSSSGPVRSPPSWVSGSRPRSSRCTRAPGIQTKAAGCSIVGSSARRRARSVTCRRVRQAGTGTGAAASVLSCSQS